MNIQRILTIGAVVLAAASGTTACGTTSGQMASAPSVVSQPSAPPVQATGAAVQPAVVASAQDGLHQDRRWPSFANCINNTATQEAFISCLRTAFLQDGTGTEIALLRGGSATPAPTALAGTNVVAGK